MKVSAKPIAVIVLLMIHMACMVAIISMTSRVHDFFPWGDPSTAGLHLISIPYVFGPTSFLTVLIACAIGLRGITSVSMLSISALIVLCFFLLPDEFSLTASLGLSLLGFLACVRAILMTLKRGAA